MTYNTGNQIGSSDSRDFIDNSAAFDGYLNSNSDYVSDRFGVQKETLQKQISDLGYSLVGASFSTGFTITMRGQLLLNDANGFYYQWNGTIPQGGYVVNPGSTPETSGGIGGGAWINRGDATLRADLESSSGASIVGYSATETVEDAIDKSQAVPVATGSANAIVINHTTPHTSYGAKYIYRFIALLTNTGSTTISIDGLGVRDLLGSAKITCQGGEVASGGYCEAVYDASIDSVVLLSCTGGNKQVKSGLQPNHAVCFGQLPIDATESAAGVVRKATDSEEVAGVSDVGFLTPLGLRNAMNASGSAPVFAVRAWVCFRQVGTQIIKASGNILSITDIAVGRSTLTFATAMSDTNYAAAGVPTTQSGSTIGVYSTTASTAEPALKLVGSCQVGCWDSSGALGDYYDASIMFLR